MDAILRRPPTETDSWAAVGVLVGSGVGVATTVAWTGCNDGMGGAESVAACGCMAGCDDSAAVGSSAAPPQATTTINVRAETAAIRKPFDFNIFVLPVRKSKSALSAPIDSDKSHMETKYGMKYTFKHRIVHQYQYLRRIRIQDRQGAQETEDADLRELATAYRQTHQPVTPAKERHPVLDTGRESREGMMKESEP